MSTEVVRQRSHQVAQDLMKFQFVSFRTVLGVPEHQGRNVIESSLLPRLCGRFLSFFGCSVAVQPGVMPFTVDLTLSTQVPCI